MRKYIANSIVDAIVYRWGREDEQEMIDCLIGMKQIGDANINAEVDMKLSEIGRCTVCGCKLDVMYGKEYHPEVDAYEPIADLYCPDCNFGGWM